MRRRLFLSKVDCDVLVAGGGVVGVQVASLLDAMGYSTILVEPERLGARQSGHSHGYIHQGYIYTHELDLVRQLREAHEKWAAILARIDVNPWSTASLIGFRDLHLAETAATAWSNAGLIVRPLPDDQRTPLLRQSTIRRLFATSESAQNIPGVLRELLLRTRCVRLRKERVLRVVRKDGFAVGATLQASRDSRATHITSKFVLLAAGTANQGILSRTFGRFRGVPAVRTSYMLALRHPTLENIALVLPEPKNYGLFMVPRPSVWLVSNFISFGGELRRNGSAGRYWAGGAMRTLETTFPWLPWREMEYGLYAAPKAEFRADPSRIPEHEILQDFGIPNLLAAWPTKLTLAPFVSERITERIQAQIGPPSVPPVPVRNDPVPPGSEHWQHVRWFSRRAFLGQLHQH